MSDFGWAVGIDLAVYPVIPQNEVWFVTDPITGTRRLLMNGESKRSLMRAGEVAALKIVARDIARRVVREWAERKGY